MKHTLLTLTTLAAGLAPLHAADLPKEIQWQLLCGESHGRELQIMTASGEVVTGYCVSITVDEMSLKTADNRVVKIGRTALARVHMQRSKGNNLVRLHRSLHHALREEFDAMLSPWGPAGAVAIPLTVAWGVAATPFCALGDLRAKLDGKTEVRVN